MYMIEPAGPHRNPSGRWKPHSTWERRAGKPGGGPDLPASMESPEWVCPAEWPGPACLPTTGVCTPVCLPVCLSVCLNLTFDTFSPCSQVSFSESGSLGNSSGSDVTSLSSQLPDTPNSMVPSPVETWNGALSPTFSFCKDKCSMIYDPPACDQLITSSEPERRKSFLSSPTRQEMERNAPLSPIWFYMWRSDWHKLRKELLHDWYGLLYRSLHMDLPGQSSPATPERKTFPCRDWILDILLWAYCVLILQQIFFFFF